VFPIIGFRPQLPLEEEQIETFAERIIPKDKEEQVAERTQVRFVTVGVLAHKDKKKNILTIFAYFALCTQGCVSLFPLMFRSLPNIFPISG
jgi:hypothetical protein